MQVVSEAIRAQMERSSWIRRMFEKGLELKRQVGAENVFDFSLGNPDLPPPAKLREAMIELADEAIKKAVKDYYDKTGVEYDPAMFPTFEDCEHCGENHG